MAANIGHSDGDRSLAQICDDVQSKSNEFYKIKKQDIRSLEEMRQNILEMTKKIVEVHLVDLVNLNVGGVLFTTGLKTLLKYPESFFARMFSSCKNVDSANNEPYFIDRDGTHFRHVLNYMRDGTITPIMKANADELIGEGEFYGLQEFVGLLNGSLDINVNTTSCKNKDDKSSVSILDEHASRLNAIMVEATSNLSKAEEALKSRHGMQEVSCKCYAIRREETGVSHLEIIKLNVGGHIFQTTIATLQKDPNSALGRMFTNLPNQTMQREDAYFIDRDGTHFRHILNYLRSNDLAEGVIEAVGEELKIEADFYQIPDLSVRIMKSREIKIKCYNTGQLYTTTAYVLHQYHALKTEFQKSIMNKRDGIFICFDKKIYLYEILQYLQYGNLSKDILLNDKENMWDVAVKCNVESLQRCLTSFWPSRIIDDRQDYIEKLTGWLKCRGASSPVLPVMFYSATDDGWESETFYQSCPGKGNTLLLFETEHGYIFGVISYVDWKKAKDKKAPDNNGQLFSLKNIERDSPILLRSDGFIIEKWSLSNILLGTTEGVPLLNVPNLPNKNPVSLTGVSGFLSPMSNWIYGLGQEQNNFLLKRFEAFTF